MAGQAPSDASRTVRVLTPGAKVGMLLAGVLVIWGLMTLAWPTEGIGFGGIAIPCGTSLAPKEGDSCALQTSRTRIQGVALLGVALLVGVGAGAIFGTREREEPSVN